MFGFESLAYSLYMAQRQVDEARIRSEQIRQEMEDARRKFYENDPMTIDVQSRWVEENQLQIADSSRK